MYSIWLPSRLHQIRLKHQISHLPFFLPLHKSIKTRSHDSSQMSLYTVYQEYMQCEMSIDVKKSKKPNLFIIIIIFVHFMLCFLSTNHFSYYLWIINAYLNYGKPTFDFPLSLIHGKTISGCFFTVLQTYILQIQFMLHIVPFVIFFYIPEDNSSHWKSFSDFQKHF